MAIPENLTSAGKMVIKYVYIGAHINAVRIVTIVNPAMSATVPPIDMSKKAGRYVRVISKDTFLMNFELLLLQKKCPIKGGKAANRIDDNIKYLKESSAGNPRTS